MRKGELRMCPKSVPLYGSETWPGRTEDTDRLVTTEKTMIRWMFGAAKDNSISSKELRSKTGITPIEELMHLNCHVLDWPCCQERHR